MREHAQRGIDANVMFPEIHDTCFDEHQLAIWWADLWGDLEFSFEDNAAYTDVLLGRSGPSTRVCLELYLCYAMCLEAAQLPSLILRNYRLVPRKRVYVPVTLLYLEVHGAIPLQCYWPFFLFFFSDSSWRHNKWYLFFVQKGSPSKIWIGFFGTSSWNSFPSSHCSCAWFPEPKQYGCTR